MINRIIKKIPLASPEPTNEYLNLCQSGYEKCDSGYTYGPAVREFYIIHYVISGKGTLKTEDSFYQLSARQAFIIYPEEVTTYSVRPTTIGHIQRGGSPSMQDRMLAAQFGNKAVRLLKDGIGNRVIGIRDNKIIDMDIIEAVSMKRTFNFGLYETLQMISM